MKIDRLAAELGPITTLPKLDPTLGHARCDSDELQTLTPGVSAGAISTISAPPGYEILGELGRGGMGIVYQARQMQLNRPCALKMILSGSLAGTEELRRFETEAKAIARLQHPHIVSIYEVGDHQGRPFLALEYCPGGNLDRKLNGTPLEATEAGRLVELLARAVGVAHSAQVVHRDLKPANILIGADGQPRIADFGLAKELDEVGMTQTGAVVGTPSFMAPEQAEGRKEIGPLADVYALGAILYDCLTGRPPFKAATTLETLRQVVVEEPVPPRRLNPALPADIETICLKCLLKEPAKRYAKALDLADDLGRFLRGEPITARPVSAIERAWRWCRRNKAVASLLLVVVLLLFGGAGTATVLALAANRSARDARNALAEKQEAMARERDVTVRFIKFLKKNPRMIQLPRQELLARFQDDNPDIDADRWAKGEAGSSSLTSAAPQMIGD